MAHSPRVHGSTFDAASLVHRLRAKWDWPATACEYWGRGVNDTYRIDGAGRRAFLRVSRRGWRTRSEIEAEISLLGHLHRGGVRVALPIRKKNGTVIESLAAPEGRRHAVLFADAGTPPRLDAGGCEAYGRLVGRFHALADRRRRPLERPRLDVRSLVDEPLERIAPLLGARPADLVWLTRVARELAEAVTSLLPAEAPAFGLCHGDLHGSNVLRDAAGRLALFDFDSSGYGWRAYDLAGFLWSRGWDFDRGAKARRTRQWNRFLDGYRSARDFSADEIRAVGLFVPLRHLWVMGLAGRLAPETGRRVLDEAWAERHVGFVRGWIDTCRLS